MGEQTSNQKQHSDAATISAAADVLTGASRKKGLARLWPFFGPAFIASIAYVDPGNFATNIQGGAQFALRLEDRPGLIKEVVDLLRARGARFVSLLSSYATSQEGYRDVYIRVKNLPPEALDAAQEELASRFELLYVIGEV